MAGDVFVVYKYRFMLKGEVDQTLKNAAAQQRGVSLQSGYCASC